MDSLNFLWLLGWENNPQIRWQDLPEAELTMYLRPRLHDLYIKKKKVDMHILYFKKCIPPTNTLNFCIVCVCRLPQFWRKRAKILHTDFSYWCPSKRDPASTASFILPCLASAPENPSYLISSETKFKNLVGNFFGKYMKSPYAKFKTSSFQTEGWGRSLTWRRDKVALLIIDFSNSPWLLLEKTN